MTVTPLLTRSLRYGGLVALGIALLGSVLGYLVAGWPGVAGAIAGALLAAVFLGLTALSILVAARVTGGDLTSPAFYGIVLAVWMLKLVLFFVVSLWLRTQDWIDPGAFSLTAIVAVLASLVADAVAFQRSRVPLDVKLPGDSAQ